MYFTLYSYNKVSQRKENIIKIIRKRKYIYTTYTCIYFPGGSDGKASAYNAGDLGSNPRMRRSPGEGTGNPLQYSCLENPMDGGSWWATVHGVAKSRTCTGITMPVFIKNPRISAGPASTVKSTMVKNSYFVYCCILNTYSHT